MKSLFIFSICAALMSCDSNTGSDAGLDDGGAGGFFRAFVAPGTTPQNGVILVTVSGETSATEGIAFPPTATGDIAFVDGWEIKFESVLTTVDAIGLSENPDLNATDPSMTGPLVAETRGPWAVDLAKAGPRDSKENNGKSWPLVRLLNQNKKPGAPSLSANTKYAFGYSLVKANSGVISVNLDSEGQENYQRMAEKGFSYWIKGTATFKGTNCRNTVATYDFARFPKTVHFSFGLSNPTTYKNCVNPDLQPADARGVQIQANAETVSQVTLHLDHSFWDALQEDAPLRFDALAARKSVPTGSGPTTASLTEVDLQNLDFQAFKDAQGTPIPWRTCGPVLSGERTIGSVSYIPGNTPTNASGGKTGLKDFYDYVQYNTSTFGHLNNDGLCFPARDYDSPN
jgi:hypothetical protein